jgi:glycosyltransferase involved in cell wall biosynthesis
MNSATDERIVFLGRISDEDIPVYMHAADIFAFPSITKNEAFGVALAEAMYCKAVPVTFNIPCSGVNWVNVKDETGLEVANKDSEAYGKAVDELIKDISKREFLAENAHTRVKNLFMPDSIKSSIYEIYM